MKIVPSLQRLITGFLCLVFCLVMISSSVLAQSIPQNDANSIYDDTVWYKPGGSCGSESVNLTGSDSIEKTLNFLMGDHGLTLTQAAAVIGNFLVESPGLDPHADQQKGTADQPTPGDGFGIAQWTSPNRQQGLVDYAKQRGTTVVADLGIQLGYFWQELTNNYKGTYSQLKSETDLVKATTDFMNGYEGPGTPHLDKRIANAQNVMKNYGGAAGGDSTASGDTSNICSTSCSASNDGSNTAAKTIVLDPGHVPGSTPANERDPLTGLYVQDYDNPTQERHNAYQASLSIGKILTADGYNVVNSKSSEDDKFNLSQRAAKDNAPNPALIVVLHGNNDGVGIAMYPDSNSSRKPKDGPRKDGTNGLVHPGISGPSKQYAEAIASAVSSKISGYAAKSFYGQYGSDGLLGNGLNPGNTPVQTILASAPEVYSEVDNSVLGTDSFASSMAAGIEKAISGGQSAANSSGGCNCSGGQVTESGLSAVRQSVVCLAQQELALWKSKPGYGQPYPNFPYAKTGYLKYTGNGCNGPPCEEWCADFVSWIYNQAGDPFTGGESGGWRLPAVSSIHDQGLKNDKFHWHQGGYVPKPGDIAIHYDSSKSAPYYHVNIFISSSGGQSHYIGGDQGPPPYPGGSIVSPEDLPGYFSDNIVGYVTPD
jgi:N-acetylmuramoyl-L-alanine amidase